MDFPIRFPLSGSTTLHLGCSCTYQFPRGPTFWDFVFVALHAQYCSSEFRTCTFHRLIDFLQHLLGQWSLAFHARASRFHSQLAHKTRPSRLGTLGSLVHSHCTQPMSDITMWFALLKNVGIPAKILSSSAWPIFGLQSCPRSPKPAHTRARLLRSAVSSLTSNFMASIPMLADNHTSQGAFLSAIIPKADILARDSKAKPGLLGDLCTRTDISKARGTPMPADSTFSMTIWAHMCRWWHYFILARAALSLTFRYTPNTRALPFRVRSHAPLVVFYICAHAQLCLPLPISKCTNTCARHFWLWSPRVSLFHDKVS